MSKAEVTLIEAEKVIERYHNPALLVSFGKDSLAMLNLLKHLQLPVICYQTPYQRDRWNFANRMAGEMGVRVYDYPPEWVGLQGYNGHLEVVTGYTIGNGQVLMIRQGVEEKPESGICGLVDCLKRPRGTIAFGWDLLLSAQKNGDTDHFGGAHAIGVDIKQTLGSADVYFPFRDWTDADVWNFCEAENIDSDDHRYDMDDKDIPARSPDWIQGCFACLRKDYPAQVACPRLNGRIVNNISATVPYLNHDPVI